MESNRGQKRADTGLDHYPHKRHKVDYDGCKNETLDSYEPPERARRTGCPPKNGTEDPTPHTALNDLMLPRGSYEYQPIKNGHTRLLYLRPGRGDEPIICSLKIFDRDEKWPKYEALSYCWGADPAVHEVEVEGQSFYTGPNLHNALRHLRRPDTTTILWVDAICIDQSNDQEKSDQIRRMSDIYRNAQNVVVWLGEEESDSDIGMDFISRLLDPGFLGDDNWPSTYARGFYALARLLERPWFSRIWVLQEVAYARNVILKCGDHELHFMDIVDACNIVKSKLGSIKRCLQNTPLYDSYGHLLQNFEDSSATRLFDLIRNVFIRSNDGQVIGKRLSLESLVCDLAPFQATDPRDSIFALLGLAKNTDTLPSSFQPDYCKSVLDVYSQFTAACARTSGSLDIICRPWAPRKKTTWQVDFVDPDLRFRVPSWIPVRGDLPFGDPKYKNKRRVHGDVLIGSARKRVYNAHNGIGAQVRFGKDDMTNTSDGSLIAKGLILCTIDELSTRMPDGVILKECLEMIGGVSRDKHDKVNGIDDSLWRTLCANRDKNGYPPPSVYRIAALHLLQTSHKGRSIDTDEILEPGAAEYQEEFLQRVQAVTWNRRIFRARERNVEDGTGKSLIGLAPRDSRYGDHICILFGVSVPVVLRHHQTDTRSCWQLVGEAYLDGSMDGEELCSLSKEEIASKTIEFELR